MSKQQQLALDATLRQGHLDLEADVATLRSTFNEVMAHVPVAGDVHQKPTTIGGVGAVEVTIQRTDVANVILYFHGGVYVIGSAATSVPLRAIWPGEQAPRPSLLATAGTTVIFAGIAQALTTRFGARLVLTLGMALLAGGMLFYAQIPVHSQFVPNPLPGYLLVGVGLGLAFVAVSIAVLSGVRPREAGLASGLLNMSQEVGGALGVAIAGSIALTHAKSLLRTGHTSAAAFTAGYALGFGVIAGVAAAGVVVALLAIPSHVSVGPAAGVG